MMDVGACEHTPLVFPKFCYVCGGMFLWEQGYKVVNYPPGIRWQASDVLYVCEDCASSEQEAWDAVPTYGGP